MTAPIDPDADRVTDVRIIRARAYEAGRLAGIEEGRRAAQTEIDALTYARGVDDERRRVETIVRHHLDCTDQEWTTSGKLFAAIRSGKAAP